MATTGFKRGRLQEALKRAMDITAGGVLFIMALPLMFLTALCIKLDSPGPVLFCQKRVGRGQKEFICYKFRSMCENASPEPHRKFVEELFQREKEGAGKKDVYKMTADPRVTRVGRVIRRLSIDELPQLINVLKGEMSMVGPRPAIHYELAHHDERMLERFSVTPGITGLWQTSGRSATTYREMVEWDLKYIRAWSLGLDLKIMARTVWYVLNVKRAY
jgi:lipopolysaccharide/colanic/teichoic acid biosynthesis glycosyltransferase